MGLLDFAKDVGRQLFDTDAEAADNIKQHLDIKLYGIKNVEVTFDDGLATVCGDCINEATRNSAVLIVGDIKGVEKVNADGLTFPEVVEEVEKVEYYEIVSGDTLGGIAKKFYGSASKYTRIHEANKELIPDPNKIYPGQKIKIPLD
jgi:nucleoid-associated protein YgaU